MNYEKAYKDLIARLQKAKENDDVCDERFCCVIDDIVPEFSELEDERIREAIIEHFAGSYSSMFPYKGFTKEHILAWLEKQGKQKSSLPKWKYKKDNTPLLRDSLVLNKYGCVLKALSGAIISDAWVLDYTELAELPREEPEKQGKMLDADKVIEWIDRNTSMFWESPCNPKNIIKRFKKDFGLC